MIPPAFGRIHFTFELISRPGKIFLLFLCDLDISRAAAVGLRPPSRRTSVLCSRPAHRFVVWCVACYACICCADIACFASNLCWRTDYSWLCTNTTTASPQAQLWWCWTCCSPQHTVVVAQGRSAPLHYNNSVLWIDLT